MSDPWPSGPAQPSGPSPWAAPEAGDRDAPIGGAPSAAPPPPGPSTATCYRHAGRNAPVTCGRCDKPICTDCMVSASVGWQCPSCAKDGTKVRNLRDYDASAEARPPVTLALIGISVAVFALAVLSGSDPLGGSIGPMERRLGLNAFAIQDGELWRIVTSGFVHFGLIHLGFNMVLLWRLGVFLERRWGSVRFALLYVASLLGGSACVLLLQAADIASGPLASNPLALTGGASGAVFGLMGAAMVCRGAGDGYRDPIETGLGGLLVVNLVITFVLPGISVGGHLGGLVVGALCGVALRFDRSKLRLPSMATATLLGLAGVLVSIIAASAVPFR